MDYSSSHILSWKEAYAKGAVLAGGKGASLGRLDSYGFPVPTGFVLSSEAYTHFLTHNGLIGQLSVIETRSLTDSGSSEDASDDVLTCLERAFGSTAMPKEIENELRDNLEISGLIGKPLAIRSSASLEDGEDASFAGMHESFLYVNGWDQIIEAVKGCYASVWSKRAMAYRKHKRLSGKDVHMAVVIMEMVDALASGVAFTCDPSTGREDLMIINCNIGLGESVVSGSVEPDEYILRLDGLAPRVTSFKAGSRTHYTAAKAGGGTELIAVEYDADKVIRAIDVSKAEQLGVLVHRVFQAMGDNERHQDIEWAYDGCRFILLQARPVTSIPVYTYPELKGEQGIWSNANFKDVMPEVQSALSWSLGKGLIDSMLSASLKASSYRSPQGIKRTKLIAGRPYLNLSILQWEMFDAFGIRFKALNQSMGGHQPEISISDEKPFQGWSGVQRAYRRVLFFIEMMRVNMRADKLFSENAAEVKSALQQDLSVYSEKQLLVFFHELLERVHTFAPKVQVLNNFAGLQFIQMTQKLETLFPDKGANLANAMLIGQSHVSSAEHGYQLLHIAELAKRDEEALHFLSKCHEEHRSWQDLSEHSPFKQAFSAYLRDFGHRGIFELDIMNPRWRESPSYLLDVIKDLTEQHTAQRFLQREADDMLTSRLGFWRKRSIDKQLARTVRSFQLREGAKTELVRLIEPLRCLSLEIGQRLAGRDLLREETDVFFCTLNEIEYMVNEVWDGTGAQLLVEERKRNREKLMEDNPPDVIIEGVSHHTTQTPVVKSKQVLEGLSLSQGCVYAEAKLIRHPREGKDLKNGQVLVVPSTDPSWTPLFLKASALVMETGGYLSHGAIVAREFGIPAIANVPGLMSRIKDGQYITVDADAGRVYINS